MLKKKCLVCSKQFSVKEFHASKGWGKYCSQKCKFAGQRNGKWLKCDHCGKEIYRTPRDHKKSANKRFFCSRNCHCAWENKNVRSGENSPNWIAGHSVYRNILKRHNQKEKCRRCGLTDKRVLFVHHIDGNRKNNKITNLEWLCGNCHYIVHLDGY